MRAAATINGIKSAEYVKAHRPELYEMQRFVVGMRLAGFAPSSIAGLLYQTNLADIRLSEWRVQRILRGHGQVLRIGKPHEVGTWRPFGDLHRLYELPEWLPAFGGRQFGPMTFCIPHDVLFERERRFGEDHCEWLAGRARAERIRKSIASGKWYELPADIREQYRPSA